MREYGPGKTRGMRGKWQCYVRYRERGGSWHTLTHMTTLECRSSTRARAEAELRHWRDLLIAQDSAKEVAEAYEMKIAKIVQGGTGRPATAALHETLSDYAKNYICRQRLGRSTGRPLEEASKRGYLSVLDRQVLPYLPQGVRVDEVSTEMVERMLYDLQGRGHYSSSTVRKAFNLLRSTLTQAVERDGLPRNPCDGLRAPAEAKPRLNALAVADADRLAQTLSGMEQTRAVTTARLALCCGMRVGEIAALKLEDCDPKREFIDVRGAIGNSNALLSRGSSYLKAPKTEASRRRIPMSAEVKSIILDRRAAIMDEFLGAGLAPSGSLYLVGDLKGGWTTPNSLGKMWGAISGSLGVVGLEGRPVTLHDLRHTFATYALAKGANPKDVQAILGHSSAQMTMDVYAVSDPAERMAMMEAVSHRQE